MAASEQQIMDKQAIREKLTHLLVDQFEVDASAISADAHLYDDLGIDSIDAVDMIVKLREMTGIQVPPEHFKDVRTVADVEQVLAALTVQ